MSFARGPLTSWSRRAALLLMLLLASCHEATGPEARTGNASPAASFDIAAPDPTAAPSSVVYVTNTSSNSVSVIDPAGNTVVETIPVGDQPAGIAVTPNGAFAYVTHVGSNDVWVIETISNAVIATVPVGIFPRSAAASPDSRHVWVANMRSNTISEIETATQTLSRTIGTGAAPFGVDFTPDGRFAYVSRRFRSMVVHEKSSGAFADVLPSSGNFLVRLTPDGAQAWVTDRGPSGVEIFETVSNTHIGRIDFTCCGAHSAAFSPDGKLAYVSNWGTGTLSVVEVETRDILDQVDVGANPNGLAVTPDGSRVYVANGESGTVSVVETTGNTVVATIPVGVDPLTVVSFVPSEFSDTEGPVTTQVDAVPDPTVAGSPVEITAFVSDVATGGSAIASAEYNVAGGNWSPMAAVDAGFDSATEDVTAGINAPSVPGDYEVCVRGSDVHGNVGAPDCDSLWVPTAVEWIDLAIDKVQQLVADGFLLEGQGTSLISKLENARTAAENGRANATNFLEAFVNEVEGLMNGGTLTATQGQTLIACAQAAIDQLGS